MRVGWIRLAELRDAVPLRLWRMENPLMVPPIWLRRHYWTRLTRYCNLTSFCYREG